MRRISLLITAMTVLIAACGGGDGAGSEYGDLIAGQFLSAGEAEGELAFTATEAQCAATAIVADFGEAKLSDLGYDPASGAVPNEDFLVPDLNDADRGRWFAAIDGCVDLKAQMITMFQEFGLTAEMATCVSDAYFASGLVEEALMTEEFDSDLNDRIDAVIGQAMTDCEG